MNALWASHAHTTGQKTALNKVALLYSQLQEVSEKVKLLENNTSGFEKT